MANPLTLRKFDPTSSTDLATWRELSLEWLEGRDAPDGRGPYLLELDDLKQLDAPEETVLAPGGQIWMAQESGPAGSVLGTVGLMPRDGQWEIIKLGVRPSARGRGVGRQLLDAVISYARQRPDIQRLLLDTSSKLAASLRLYERCGFKRLPEPTGHFATADVAMELVF